MTICNMSLATNQDDEILRECVKNNEMKGSISVAFETEPSFFDSISVQGRESQVMVGKTEEGDLMGLGVRSIKQVYINEKVMDIGYLSGLRVNPEFRNNSFLSGAYKFFKKLDQDGKVPFYLTTIIEDNAIARRILESGRGGLPNYMPFGFLSTFIIKPQTKKNNKRYEIIKGNNMPLENIVNFLNKEGSKKQFYPHYKTSDFNSIRLRGLKQEDFYLAMEGNNIIGTIAKWNQESFKQTRIVKYDKKMKITRPFINLISKFSNIPNLPKAGDLLHYFYAAFPTTKNNNPEILESLLCEVASDPENKEYDYFALGLSKMDSLAEAAKLFTPRTYNARLYVVSFDKTKDNLKFLNGKIPYLELGTL